MGLDTTARLKLDDNIVMQFGNKLYSQEDWWVILRELLQNALDSGAKRIDVKSDWTTFFEVTDNGCGMDKETLLTTFLTVGGSDKRDRSHNTVGGFGIAKLAIFACDDFEVVSHGWILTKKMLLEHLPIEKAQTDDIRKGTRVRVKKQDMFSWDGSQSQHEFKTFLSLVDRDVKIFLNCDEVPKATTESFVLNNYEKSVYATSTRFLNNRCVILVRANGLPVFRNTLYSIDRPIMFVYDVFTDLDPYDDDYPFTMTRDEFAGEAPERKEFYKFSNAIQDHFSKLFNLETEKREMVKYDEETGFYSRYDVKFTPEIIALLMKYKNYIELLFNLKSSYTSVPKFGIGVIGDPPEDAPKKPYLEGGAFFNDGIRGQPVFLISKYMTLKEQIIGVALHEFSHKSEQNHYDRFASEMTANTMILLSYLFTAKEN